MNKRGLLGKIFEVIGIILILVITLVGITVYQIYHFYKTGQAEQQIRQDKMTEAQQMLQNLDMGGMCNATLELEASDKRIQAETENICKNPIIRWIMKTTTEKTASNSLISRKTVSCDNLDLVFAENQNSTQQIKDICSNQTLMNQIEQLKAMTANSTETQ